MAGLPELCKKGNTGEMVKKKILPGKIRELENLMKIRKKSETFKICFNNVKRFKFDSCVDVHTGGFFLKYV